MKRALAKAIIDDCRKRGYVEHQGVLYPPGQAATLSILETTQKRKPRTTHTKTGWIDDTRNIANKEKQTDVFIKLIKQELNLDVWPEFYFSTEREYRFDYAVPIMSNSTHLKIAIEVNGGIWAKGNSGHSSGTGIKRDMEKSNLAQANGWKLISVEPNELTTLKTLDLIKKLCSL
ncbi:hypothetical protein J3L18_00065 [Mucilaginibacter gossypii]|uniref:hypothetical protein n=1 Tax=Mucilaginibacter gossypii TaxID=551996 RepID=UPI000DCB32AF|nr:MULTISPECIES: hypothetical protein [Mucilaginibacter]QTE37497.1 hypothetical protein J3L18_00065 [Mucilaginibacter gossypii]RAV52322.1 hypothetical protein DIU36_24620 [Mucilaginibacter rubeus]